MNEGPDLSTLARTIGEPSRVRILALLMGGRALTAKELAYGVGIDPATGTAHLKRLQAEGLITMAAQGRHRYFRIASVQVARMVESLMVLGGGGEAPRDEPIRRARFCYDHLAGELGTRLADALVDRGLVSRADATFVPTEAGERWLASVGIDVAALRGARRSFARACLDWSERRDHLAGALGAALAARMLELAWIERERRSRVVTVTELGRRALREQLGLELGATAAARAAS
jgi:DNA-binding transcriptional ArsR family regulator